jgi:hypothetical protein
VKEIWQEKDEDGLVIQLVMQKQVDNHQVIKQTGEDVEDKINFIYKNN